jgi:hypothetical protein
MRKGFRGYPVGTVAFYGPDDRRATKVVAGIVEGEDQGAGLLKKWFSEELDVRLDPGIGKELSKFLGDCSVRSYTVTEGIIGCPHEEGIDYPEGEACPKCPFWADKDRWANV